MRCPLGSESDSSSPSQEFSGYKTRHSPRQGSYDTHLNVHSGHAHPVHGQKPSLVNKQHGDVADVLNCMQVPHDNAILRHFDHGKRNRKGDDQRKTFGDGHDEDGQAESDDVKDADSVEQTPSGFGGETIDDKNHDEEYHHENGDEETDYA